MATGVIARYYKDGTPQKQVLVVITSGWSVLCFDHNLQKLWETNLQEDFPHNAHHREIAISISNYTLKHGDTGLVIVGGRMELQPNVCRRKKSSVGGRMEMQPMHIQWLYGDGDGDEYENETVFRTFSCLSVVGFVNFGNTLCLACIYIFF